MNPNPAAGGPREPTGVSTGGRWVAREKAAGAELRSTSEFDGTNFDTIPDIGTADQDTLRGLAGHPDSLVRAEVTSSPRVPDDVLMSLYEDEPNTAVKIAAVNAGGGPELASAASADDDDLVRAVAYSRWDLPPEDRDRLKSDAGVQRLMGMIAR